MSALLVPRPSRALELVEDSYRACITKHGNWVRSLAPTGFSVFDKGVQPMSGQTYTDTNNFGDKH